MRKLFFEWFEFKLWATLWLYRHGIHWNLMPLRLGTVWNYLFYSLLTLELGREMWLLHYLPRRAQQAAERGDTDTARHLLRRVVEAWMPFSGKQGKFKVRYQLGVLYMTIRRYEDAAEQWRLLLALMGRPLMRRVLSRGLEAELRRRLADCVEALGDVAGAQAERGRASACVEGIQSDKEDLPSLLSQASLLNERQAYPEECQVLQRALALSSTNQIRAEVLVRLALASFNSGRHADTARYGDEAIAQQPPTSMLMQAHAAAALGYVGINDLAQAEAHRWRAYELATGLGNQDQAGQYLAQVALVQMSQGKISQAITTCEQAEAMGPHAARLAFHTHSDCLRALGRFDEAQQMILNARQTMGYFVPHLERRSQAVFDLALALVLGTAAQEIETASDAPASEKRREKAQEAWDYLQRATVELAHDARLTLWCDAASSWLLALLAQREAALDKAQQVCTGLGNYAHDHETISMCSASLGRSAYLLDCFEESMTYWKTYMEQNQKPVWQPNGFYHIAECHRQLGQLVEARTHYEAAIATGIECYMVQQAHHRLQQLEQESNTVSI